MQTILTFDIGGSFIRAALFDLKGGLIDLKAEPSDPAYVGPGGVEADPAAWWSAICRLTAALLAEKSANSLEIKAIVPCGMTRTQVFLDAKGESLRPAITFRDARAGEQAARLGHCMHISSSMEPATGLSPISAFHPLARLMWVRDHEPRVMAQVRWVLQPKDYITHRLTGQAVADGVSSASYSLGDGLHPPPEVFQALGLDSKLVPPLAAPQALAGYVQPNLPRPFEGCAGVPVFTGSMDAWCGTLGIGAVRPGFAYNISGTTESMGLVWSRPLQAPGLLSLPWGDGLHQVGGPSQAGGDCLTWLLENFAGGSAGLDDAFHDLDMGLTRVERPAPLFLPFLQGERVPLWNPEARGVFFGLKRTHNRDDLIRAVMQGVALANRHILSLAEAAAGDKAGEIRVTGGVAKLDPWCQIKADVLQRPLVRTSQEEAGLLGAALLAIRGLGLYEDFALMQDELVQVQRRFEPDPRLASHYDQAFKIYLSLIKSLAPGFAKFAELEKSCLETAAHD